MKAAAVAHHTTLLGAKPHLSLRENLAEVRTEITKRYPEKFENPRRAQASAVAESSSPPARRGKGRSFEELPSEAKDACKRFVKQIPGFTEKQYVAQYFAGEE